MEWAITCGGGGYMTIKTLQIPSEITRLDRTVAALKPKIIPETGTARGGTLLIWSSIASEEVIGCDMEHYAAQKPLLEALTPPGSKCKVTLLTGNSHDAVFKQRVARALNGRKADFICSDGDQSGLSPVKEDQTECGHGGIRE